MCVWWGLGMFPPLSFSPHPPPPCCFRRDDMKRQLTPRATHTSIISTMKKIRDRKADRHQQTDRDKYRLTDRYQQTQREKDRLTDKEEEEEEERCKRRLERGYHLQNVWKTSDIWFSILRHWCGGFQMRQQTWKGWRKLQQSWRWESSWMTVL